MKIDGRKPTTCLLEALSDLERQRCWPTEELVDTQEPAWPIVKKSWLADTKNSVEVLPSDRESADAALLKLQVTTRSPTGAIVHGRARPDRALK